MSLRHTKASGRGLRSAAAASAVLLALTACGGGGDDGSSSDDKKKSSSGDSPKSDDTATEVDTKKEIGKLEGADGISVTVHSAERDPGGFLTIQATLTNGGNSNFRVNRWTSAEEALKSRSSVSGATVIDKKGKKRYMVLRDTDGQCLCTTDIPAVKPNESQRFFAQFPSPPKGVDQVEFQIPTLTPANLKINEG